MIKVISKFGDRHKCLKAAGSYPLTKNPFSPIPSERGVMVYQRGLLLQEL